MAYVCKFCGKEFSSLKGCSYHSNRCDSNPDRVYNVISEEHRRVLSEKAKAWCAKNKDKRSETSKKMWASLSDEKRVAIRKNQKVAWDDAKKAEQRDRLIGIYDNNEELRSRIGKSVKATFDKEGGKTKLIEGKLKFYDDLYKDEERAKGYFRDKAIKVGESRKGLSGYNSTWEKVFAEFLDRIGVEYEREVPLPYVGFDGKQHMTAIDFKVGDLYFEVKGSHLLEGVYDHGNRKIEDKIALYKQKHIILITNDKVETRDLIGRPNGTKSNGLKYLHKCPEPLIGVDIELFNGPEFPYRSDRPKCFYNTRVNNQRSMREAWDDEKLRWNMIINRIQYSGGFIDANGIVNALNITRKCKQPSWFSKNYAKELIEEFVTTGVIVDGFAGYGMRHDAAIEMGLEYHGIDFNEELVKWHHECNRNIEYADANTWKKTINKPHSVLICPPYTDYEVYFDGQDVEKTQEDWLDVMMKNYPNATEYIMVCKIVDRYADNVVTQKNNNGVIGKNVEKVIVIKNPSN